MGKTRPERQRSLTIIKLQRCDAQAGGHRCRPTVRQSPFAQRRWSQQDCSTAPLDEACDGLLSAVQPVWMECNA